MADETTPSTANLRMPDRQEWGLPKPPRGGSRAVWLVLALVLALVCLEAYDLYQRGAAPASSEGDKTSAATANEALSGINLKELSTRLQRNNLPQAAASVLAEHLQTLPAAEKEERHKVLLTLANLLFEAGDYEQALVRYYQSESLLPGSRSQDLIDRRVAACLEKLGRFDELGYELADRTASGRGPGDTASPGDEAASRVVARIGIEKITAADLDALVAEQIDRQLGLLEGMDEENRQAYRKQLLASLREPRQRLQLLRELVARRVLYREGTSRGVDRSQAVREELDELRRSLVAQEVVREKMRQLKISESDFELFYQANKERYVEPASARARIAVLEDAAAARSFLDAVESEADFERLARERSTHAPTRERGGALQTPVRPGEPVGELGHQPALAAAVLSTPAGEAAAEPVETAAGHVVYFVQSKTPSRQLSFEEARERVVRDYSQRKEREAQQELLDELFEKYRVVVHTEAFLKREPGTESNSQGDGTEDASDSAAAGPTPDARPPQENGSDSDS